MWTWIKDPLTITQSIHAMTERSVISVKLQYAFHITNTVELCFYCIWFAQLMLKWTHMLLRGASFQKGFLFCLRQREKNQAGEIQYKTTPFSAIQCNVCSTNRIKNDLTTPFLSRKVLQVGRLMTRFFLINFVMITCVNVSSYLFKNNSHVYL